MLVILRNPAAANRLSDLVRPLTADPRLEVWFTVDHGSGFAGGLPARLTAMGALQLSWAEAVEEQFDLALAASDKTDLHLVQAPVMLMPHGAGFHRFAADTAGEISGLRRSALIHDGEVVPATIVVAHEADIATLNDIDRRLPERALVAGDPAYQRIVRNLPLRHRYRQALTADGRELVLLCSTWGPESLFGRNPQLPHDIVTTLPVDRFAVALTMHPNVWERHGELQVRAWTRSATAAGLRLIPAQGEWRSVIVAADLVISDHGSLTAYAAAIGKPTLFAANGGGEVVPGSMMDRLRGGLPQLRTGESLEPQITAALVGGARDSELAASAFAAQDALATMLTRAYEILNLPLPQRTARNDGLPIPEVAVQKPTVLHATITEARESGDHATLRLHRTVAPSSDCHLVANDHTDDISALERASAVFSGDLHPSLEHARTRARHLLHTFPGARLTMAETADGAKVAVLRDHREATIVGSLPISVACSGVYWWSRTPDRPQRITIGSGTILASMTIQS
ncbi:hypothetical protein [Amycolatopsis sp. NPDC058986]|uniref:hypothetical protein n=1 Tax=unclassified Amycolatopsis TaxID=2618356 RepID=UPI0036718A08